MVSLIVLVVMTIQITFKSHSNDNNIIEITIPANNDKGITKSVKKVDDSNVSTASRPPPPAACTTEQKSIIMKHLDPTLCHKDQGKAFEQKCSLTQATKCPKQTWITDYYQHKHKNKNHDDHDTAAGDSSFVAVYVGCNKGYDAVNTLRMGSGDKRYNKQDWRGQLQETFQSVCAQNEDDLEFPIHHHDHSSSLRSSSSPIIDATVHCLEPTPRLADRLLSSVKNLGWDNNLLVTQAAISKNNGEMYFPNPKRVVGVENQGLSNCARLLKKGEEYMKKVCVKVNVFTLDHYMENVTTKKATGMIDLLSIDVEGFDFDVMLGGSNTLSKTKYLEFEYNWMGSWATQNLKDAIKYLDEFGFTCYWAGTDRLWRIDESCWLDHYDFHTWSNVACVNRILQPEVAKNMEDTFLRTLSVNR